MVNKFTHIKERVVQIAKKQAMSQERFFHSIGMTSASFRGKAKGTPLNSKAIANIITKYPDVDVYWLLLGEKDPSQKNRTGESGLEYEKSPQNCQEKDELIAMLRSQIEDLKSDKEDLKRLLGLKEEK